MTLYELALKLNDAEDNISLFDLMKKINRCEDFIKSREFSIDEIAGSEETEYVAVIEHISDQDTFAV